MTDSRRKVLWGLQILVALVLTFPMGWVPKLLSQPEVLANFERWGYPAGFHYLVGAGELAAAALLLIPRTALFGALLAVAIMLGAIGTHLLNGELAFAPIPAVVLGLAGYVALARWRERQGAPQAA